MLFTIFCLLWHFWSRMGKELFSYILFSSCKKAQRNYAGEFFVVVRRKSRNKILWQILGMLV